MVINGRYNNGNTLTARTQTQTAAIALKYF
jgi:hypothetical protein